MVAQTGESISQLLETARALRHARRMHEQFMLLWALDRAKGIAKSDDSFEAEESSPVDEFADPQNRDWSILYRGSVLDD